MRDYEQAGNGWTLLLGFLAGVVAMFMLLGCSSSTTPPTVLLFERLPGEANALYWHEDECGPIPPDAVWPAPRS